ncbi:hypothetical protein U8C37_04085 [Sinorhizobium medicae]|uniref:Uncharacterized protein n=1 Tax=Sinorhizobium medicae TaxID=110321 RepID=A0A508X0Q5_9HYPH|nr:hypothetical protein [Sinorhizobium medicae]WQO86571.1 hypothetical protein U8C37_04085 [Sinorhizobium medicae]VTZ63442.1 hypothetical protein EMEDMD4_50119 [Sinorhizobium medicae]
MVLLTRVVSLHSPEDALEELGGQHTPAVELFAPFLGQPFGLFQDLLLAPQEMSAYCVELSSILTAVSRTQSGIEAPR